MKAYHIHIEGIVQGVGFRPFVYKLCLGHSLTGWVNNTNDGVHIHINTTKTFAEILLKELIDKAPELSIITGYKMEEIEFVHYDKFEIIHSSSGKEAKLLLTPDFAICDDCAKELYQKDNSRYLYPFITCTNCGPRYSIIKSLPYDRETTTMSTFEMCDTCRKEYDNPLDRRYYSQTNSCLECPVELSIYENGKLINKFEDLDYIVNQWEAGKIIAIKGIGGYILTCDASNQKTVSRLRTLKQRPTKPFALMYHSVEELKNDVEIREIERESFLNFSAPIILLNKKDKPKTPLAYEQIAPNSDILGVMLPYTPLYKLLLDKFQKPIVATSGNISNSTIIYEDKIAYEELSKIADIIISNNREIVIPQDDSVIRYSKSNNAKIIIRRSRGLAPSYINADLNLASTSVLAMGAMLKSTFTLLNQGNIYISQYLGSTDNFEAENNYKNTLNHFEKLLNPDIKAVIIDKHPNYFTSIYGKEIADRKNIETFEVQHHKAHFFAVLGENNLLDSTEDILGVIWDGTGLGEDGNIWGGEFFKYSLGEVKRVDHLDEFPFILGDKMPKEPRISALAVANNSDEKQLLENKFSKTEWKIYNKLLTDKDILKTTSAGRLFDAIASIVLGIDKQTFEGEAAMQLEAAAMKYFKTNDYSIDLSYLRENHIPGNFIEYLVKNIFGDKEKQVNPELISAKFHTTLIDYIYQIAEKHKTINLAFSGGVFQNQLLVDIIISFMKDKYKLYFHKELSPNDECISFGQVVCYSQYVKP